MAYDRLSGQDSTFLVFESPTTHMHVATTMIFEAGPLRTEGGGIDFAAFRRANEAALHRIPRYRQKLDYTPIERWPVWGARWHFR